MLGYLEMSSRIVGIILKPMLSVGGKSGVRRLAIGISTIII